MAILSGSVLSLLLNNLALVAVFLVPFLIYLTTRNHDFFKKRGIPYEKPVPIFGNLLKPFLRQETFAECFQRIYTKFPKASVVGFFEFVNQIYLIKDPELIKQITIKDFDSFINHRSTIDHDADPIFGRNLFAIKDQRWKDMRTILSPAFTGSKMRFLFDLIRNCAKTSFDYLDAKTTGNNYDFEAKDLFTRLSNDVIATAAFGLEINSFKDRDNLFYKNGRILTNFDALLSIKFFMVLNFPKLTKLLRVKLLNEDTSMYFKQAVLETMKMREQTGMVRPDLIQLLVQTKAKQNENSEQIQWTDDDFVAQSVLFFLAGFDTTATLFSFMAYELALNPEIQARLHEEVDEMKSNLEGKEVSYEDINKLKYMDMVVQEALRKWPPAIQSDRMCNKTVTLRNSSGFELQVKAGESIAMPTFSIHRDPQFFPNPDVFDPERFSDENKDDINPFAYQPFGIGPRQCIGNRFALMECKVLFFYILTKFRIEKNDKTEIPLQMVKGVFNNTAKNGIHLSFKRK